MSSRLNRPFPSFPSRSAGNLLAPLRAELYSAVFCEECSGTVPFGPLRHNECLIRANRAGEMPLPRMRRKKKALMEAAAGAEATGPPRRCKRDHQGRWCLGLPGSHPGSFGCAGLGGHHLTDHLTYIHDWTTSFLGAPDIAGPVPASLKSTADVDPRPGPSWPAPLQARTQRGLCHPGRRSS